MFLEAALTKERSENPVEVFSVELKRVFTVCVTDLDYGSKMIF